MRVIEEDIWVSRCLRELGEHSEAELNMMYFCLGLLSHGKYDSTVVDAGAYIGDLTVPLSRMCKTLYAFEPHKGNRELLEHNLRINSCSNVTVFPYALGAESGIVRYNSTDATSPGSSQMGLEEGDAEVEMVTLDQLGLSPDFIKADIEGGEIPLLAGAQDTLEACRSTLFLERDTVTLQGAPPMGEILHTLGYDTYPMSFPMWRADNFRGAPNTFGTTVAHMMLAIPSGRRLQ